MMRTRLWHAANAVVAFWDYMDSVPVDDESETTEDYKYQMDSRMNDLRKELEDALREREW